MKYPYARPEVTDGDIALVTAAMKTQFLTQGDSLVALEAAIAESFGVAHVVVCNSGTAALHLAYMALGLGPERGLVTSAVTFLATANAAVMCGAPVAFADVDPETGNVTPETLRAAAEGAGFAVGAVAPVHLGGRPCDLPAIRALADRLGCAVVEDACHAPRAVYLGADGAPRRVGACAHSDAAVFSFHAIKHVAMGEGGAVCTNDPAIAGSARMLRNHGMIREPAEWQAGPEADAPWYYEMQALGWNYRASELNCALGLGQLRRLEDSLGERRRIAARYNRLLGNVPHLRTPPPPPVEDGHAWHLYPLAIDFDALGKSRGEVMRALAAKGVGTQVHYIPLYRQPYYRARGHVPLPGAERYYARTLSIPMYAGLQPHDVDEIAAAIREVLDA